MKGGLMSTQLIGMFPGQGSQKVGMGKELFDSSELAKEYFESANAALGFSLSDICFSGPDEELVKTCNGQPAILTVSVICYELAKESLSTPLVAAAGHSLGEYSALVAAGAIQFADAVSIVHKRGTYMQEAVAVGEGKMLAVLGKEVEALEEILANVDGVIEIANINAPGQIVISGAAASIDAAREALSGTKVIELAVSAPFHCSLMQPAADSLAADLDALTIEEPAFPVFANVLAEGISDPAVIRKALKEQVCGRVRWVETIENMKQQFPEATYIEFGAGAVLSGLLKRIDRTLPKKAVASLADVAAL
jgi:[acyl-carrier-protein] S-malonyltransferase